MNKPARKPKPTACSKCGNPKVAGRGLCRPHYQQAYRAGTLDAHDTKADRADKPECPDDHKHDGSTVCYRNHGCRCAPCRARRSKEESLRSKQKAYGTYDSGFVDATPVRQHLQKLGEYGIGQRQAAELAEVSRGRVTAILYGRRGEDRSGQPSSKVDRAIAARILAVRLDFGSLAQNAVIPARGAHRRVQALMTLGWTLTEIGDRCGVSVHNFSAMMRREQMRAQTHRTVAAVYEQLSMTLPPSSTTAEKQAISRSQNHARANGYRPPLAWDDIDLDDDIAAGAVESEETPEIDEVAVELALTGTKVKLTKAERDAAITEAHRRRWSDQRTADVLRLNVRTIIRERDRLKLKAWPTKELIHVGFEE
ncbi:hypothetical protein ACFVAJ_17465 [Agromyces sp. NPDC057679]|uniref:hypothetical protein n=1 Tax=Agromyces sp. NPDC057679 TaxID=3346207 RepID=UPI0036720468